MSEVLREEKKEEIIVGKYLRFWYRNFNTFLLGKVERVVCLEDGRKIINEDDRKVKYFDFQKALLEEAPAIFLYFPKYSIVYLKKSETLLNKVLNLQI